jgi:hypothetical protein
LRNDRVVIKYIAVRQGYNMRIAPNNAQKELEHDEQYVFDLTSLINLAQWNQKAPDKTLAESNRVIERINASPETTTSRQKRVSSHIEEEDESSDTNDANEDSCIPRRKKAKLVPAETYNDLHLDFTEICKQHDMLSKENQEIKQRLEQANQKICAYRKLQASIQRLHKQALTIEKTNDREVLLKMPRVFNYNDKDFFMQFDDYQKFKYRNQTNIVMSQLMQIIQLPMHRYCLPMKSQKDLEVSRVMTTFFPL